jgi:hypothetical protein
MAKAMRVMNVESGRHGYDCCTGVEAIVQKLGSTR